MSRRIALVAIAASLLACPPTDRQQSCEADAGNCSRVCGGVYCPFGTRCVNGACRQCTAGQTPQDDGTCYPLAAGGESCTYDVECASGVCTAGVCCDRACDAECDSCETGVCLPRSIAGWGIPLEKGTGNDNDRAVPRSLVWADGRFVSLSAARGRLWFDAVAADGSPIASIDAGIATASSTLAWMEDTQRLAYTFSTWEPDCCAPKTFLRLVTTDGAPLYPDVPLSPASNSTDVVPGFDPITLATIFTRTDLSAGYGMKDVLFAEYDAAGFLRRGPIRLAAVQLQPYNLSILRLTQQNRYFASWTGDWAGQSRHAILVGEAGQLLTAVMDVPVDGPAAVAASPNQVLLVTGQGPLKFSVLNGDTGAWTSLGQLETTEVRSVRAVWLGDSWGVAYVSGSPGRAWWTTLASAGALSTPRLLACAPRSAVFSLEVANAPDAGFAGVVWSDQRSGTVDAYFSTFVP